jgi:hypothetical protein
MKIRILTFISSLALIGQVSCTEVKSQEEAATIMNLDHLECGGCGGWIVQVDSASYRADIPAPYNKDNTPVWIRFRKDESSGNKVSGRWIIISSIRERK